MKRKILFPVVLFCFIFAFSGCALWNKVTGNNSDSSTSTSTATSALLKAGDAFGEAQKAAVDRLNELVAAAAKKNLITVDQEKKYMDLQHKIVKAQIVYAGVLDKVETGSLSSLNTVSSAAEFISVFVQALDLVESFGVEIPSDLKNIKNGLSLALTTS